MQQNKTVTNTFESLSQTVGQTVKPVTDEAKKMAETAKFQALGQDVGTTEQGQQVQSQVAQNQQISQMKQQSDQKTQGELAAVRRRFFEKRKTEWEKKPQQKKTVADEKEEEKKVKQFEMIEKKKEEEKKLPPLPLAAQQAQRAIEVKGRVGG